MDYYSLFFLFTLQVEMDGSCNKDNQWNALENELDFLKRVILSDVSSQQEKLNTIGDWVKEQKKKSENKTEQKPVEDVGKILEAVIKGTKKFKSGSEVEIARDVLDIISSVATLAGGPQGPAMKAVCGVIGAILIRDAPKQPSVVNQLANALHKELVNFNKKLQDQKYDGLRRRVSDQAAQLRTMKPGEKLDDPNLWNDFIQFMGELTNRLESPLPFKYNEQSLTKDPDVADFVTAVVTYCHAYSCFMALLMATKGKFSEMGSEYKENEGAVNRKISCQRTDAQRKLSFLSDGRYLTFLGSLPYEGGKLTKILVLSRKLSAKRLVEVVRSSLIMPQMPDLTEIESAAAKVSCQTVKLKLDDRHQIPPGNGLRRMVSKVIGPIFWVQFVNETDFPMKVVSGTAGECKKLEFVQDIQPWSSYPQGLTFPLSPFFSTGGYLMIYLNGILSSGLDPPADDVRVIEFAFSREKGWVHVRHKINIQDKTSDEFTRGQDAYNAMECDEAKTLYWFNRGIHFMMRAEMVKGLLVEVWRFFVQDFDPLSLQD